MLRTLDTNHEFEALARAFLTKNSQIRHEWRQVRDAFGGRTDLVCYPGEPHEVFASLTATQITVGFGGEETDFEDFGRGLTAAQLAAEAFLRFKHLLARKA
jgi:hypothetical protein